MPTAAELQANDKDALLRYYVAVTAERNALVAERMKLDRALQSATSHPDTIDPVYASDLQALLSEVEARNFLARKRALALDAGGEITPPDDPTVQAVLKASAELDTATIKKGALTAVWGHLATLGTLINGMHPGG